jgi:phosphoglucan, water dikinase
MCQENVTAQPLNVGVGVHDGLKMWWCVQAKLPSFSERFTASTPLTRIRDIAHRNDIPGDLKREIKHTLQNKLHRNAGPEDLVATEAMLERITTKGADFSPSFVNEFRVFTDELRDFFNAGSLVQLLEGINPALGKSEAATVEQFIKAKAQLDNQVAKASLSDVVDCMHKLTSVCPCNPLLPVMAISVLCY